MTFDERATDHLLAQCIAFSMRGQVDVQVRNAAAEHVDVDELGPRDLVGVQPWAILIFPAWVFLVSAYLLVVTGRGRDELRVSRGDTRYVLAFAREHTLVSQTLIDFASGVRKLVAEIIRYPGGYLRFSGPVILDRYRGDEVVEHYEEPGSFEQCYWQRDIHGER